MTRIRELRQKQGLSQAALAKSVNVDQTAVSKWELEKSFPDIAVALRVADYFGVSIDYLLGRDEIKKEPVTNNDDGLTEFDKDIIRRIRNLPPEKAEIVYTVLRGFEEDHK